MATILIVEDERELARVVQSYLEQAGMTVRVEDRGDRGLRALK
jgi:DNA-binding response OmpR family regulator